MKYLKQLLAISICTIASLPSATAQQYPYKLNGYMGIQGGEMFSYKVELKDSLPGLLTGYAYTYLNKDNDVKTTVVAQVNVNDKTIYLKEKEIVYNNYFKSKAIICLVEAMLTYKPAEHIVTGQLNTNTAGSFNTNCSKGSVNFANLSEVDAIFNKVSNTESTAVVNNSAPTIKPAKPVRYVYDTVSKAKPITPAKIEPVTEPVKRIDEITAGKDKEYIWKSSEIVLELWDGNSVDNDRVTIHVNGNPLLQNYTLTKQTKRISIPTGGNELNIITIEAMNEGAEPPNTAHINLIDQDTTYNIIAHNTVGKKAVIRIRKKL